MNTDKNCEKESIGKAPVIVRLHLKWVVAATVIIEIVTCFNRFVLGLKSTDQQHLYTDFTFGIRIHHAYWGAVLFLIGFFLVKKPLLQKWLTVIGLACVLSDVIHHYLVLLPLTGGFG